MSGDTPIPGLTSIVVVAADSGPLLSGCIRSVLASEAAVEVILVDNASRDGEVERVAATHRNDARFRLLRNGVNLGFGPACNRGAALASGDAFLFLNPDCDLRRDTIAAFRAAAGLDAGIGVLGANVLAPDGKPARGNRRREPSLRRAMASMTGLSRWEGRWPGLAGIEMPASAISATSPVEFVEAISGACIYMPRRAFERVGGFDEAYFLHAEDLDLCRRTRDAGLRVGIANFATAVHAQGSSSRRRCVFVARHKHRGMWRYFRKFDPAAANPLLSALVWIGIWTHFALMLPAYAWRSWRASRPARASVTSSAAPG
jgi:GT2 family glycosyltransferase